MKIFFSFVIVVLLGLCAWIRFTSTRPTEAHRSIISGLKSELKESRLEFDATNEALAIAKGEIEKLKLRLSSLEGEAVARSFPGQNSPVPEVPDSTARVTAASVPVAASAVAVAPVKAGTLEGLLSELRATYEIHRISIEDRKGRLESDLAALKASRRSLENTDLNFSEQSSRIDADGSVTGNRGVRTSSADRDRATAKITEKITEVDREIARKQTEHSRAVGELASLRDNYSKAILRARGEFGVEFGGGGLPPATGN